MKKTVILCLVSFLAIFTANNVIAQALNDDSIENLRKEIDKDPENGYAHLKLAEILAQGGGIIISLKR